MSNWQVSGICAVIAVLLTTGFYLAHFSYFMGINKTRVDALKETVDKLAVLMVPRPEVDMIVKQLADFSGRLTADITSLREAVIDVLRERR